MTSVWTVGATKGSARQNTTTRHYPSSFPRKRESRATFPQRKTGRYGGPPPPDSRFRGNDEHLYGRSAERVGAAKRNNSPLPFVIPAKAGIWRRRSHKKNRTDMADDRPRIPAFAGMTSVSTVGAPKGSARQNTTTRHYPSSFPRKRESRATFPQRKTGRYGGPPPPDSRFRGNDECLDGRSDERAGAAKHSNPQIILRHSRESGNPSAPLPQEKTGSILRTTAAGFPLARE